MTPAPDMPRRLLITAGPTHEAIDDVRYIANRSSGRMGIALAAAAVARDISTTLVLGPSPLSPPVSTRLEVHRFRSTADLEALLVRLWPGHDVLIMAAAVADYRPVAAGKPGSTASGAGEGGKLARVDRPITLTLEPTPDLVAGLAATSRRDQVLIGFALEPADRLDASARRKLERKGLDAIVANPLDTMDSDRVSATVHLRSGETLTPPPDLSKSAFAEWLIDRLPRIVRAHHGDSNAPT
jgi:phosphopantothenoylcysteine decarboxylase/phosphopantothenate--cysteine ligase